MVTIIGMVTILGIVVILRIFIIVQDCNNLKGQGHLMIFYPPRDGDLPRDGDCPRDGDGNHHRYDDQ